MASHLIAKQAGSTNRKPVMNLMSNQTPPVYDIFQWSKDQAAFVLLEHRATWQQVCKTEGVYSLTHCATACLTEAQSDDRQRMLDDMAERLEIDYAGDMLRTKSNWQTGAVFLFVELSS